MLIIETNMDDGVDLEWCWDTIEEAIESGRFEYIEETGFNDEYDEDGNLTYSHWDFIVENSKTLEEFIENVGYPFYIEK